MGREIRYAEVMELGGGEADDEQPRSNISVEKRETTAMEAATHMKTEKPST